MTRAKTKPGARGLDVERGAGQLEPVLHQVRRRRKCHVGRERGDDQQVDVARLAAGGFPATANLIQDRLKLTCPAFDVQAACAGFVFALVIAAQFVATGNSQCALVIGGDCNSRVINPGDQKSFPLFGDGAGAVVLAPGEKDQGLVAYQLGSDGSGGDLLSRPACGSRIPPVRGRARKGPPLPHHGRPGRLQVGRPHPGRFRPGRPRPRQLPGAGDPLVHPPPGQRADHPRRQRRPRLPPRRGLQEPRAYGNTSAGSIPIALDELYRDGAIQRGDLILTSGFGAGLNWGTALWRW